MIIEPLMPVEPSLASAQKFVSTPAVQEKSSFGDWFVNELNTVNDRLVTSDHDAQALATGEVQSLHEVMIRMEETRQSFQLLLQVRNRLLEAYQEVMRTQV